MFGHYLLLTLAGQTDWPSWLHWIPHGLRTWEAWVAIGTLTLAAMTGALAIASWRLAARTEQDVRASTRSADAAEAAFAMSTRPCLFEVPIGRYLRQVPSNTIISGATGYHEVDEADIDIDVYDDKLLIEIPLRNAGQGIAFLGEPTLEIDVGGRAILGVTLSTAVAPGELTRLDFQVKWETPEEANPYKAPLSADGRRPSRRSSTATRPVGKERPHGRPSDGALTKRKIGGSLTGWS